MQGTYGQQYILYVELLLEYSRWCQEHKFSAKHRWMYSKTRALTAAGYGIVPGMLDCQQMITWHIQMCMPTAVAKRLPVVSLFFSEDNVKIGTR